MPPALDGVTLRFMPGDTVAVVGRDLAVRGAGVCRDVWVFLVHIWYTYGTHKIIYDHISIDIC